MANFNEAVLTRKGIGLLAKAQAGQTGITMTKAASGSGVYEADEPLTEKESLKDQRQEFPFDKVSVENNTTVSLKFTITNEQAAGNLQEGYHVKEVGIFATDPDEGEILYAIATAVENQWDYMPAYITVEFYAEVSNASQVIINCAGRFVTAEEMEAELEAIRELITGFDNKFITAKSAEIEHKAIRKLIEDAGKVPDGVLTTKDKGVANGVASLDSRGQIPEEQLPKGSGAIYIGDKLSFKDFTWTAIEGNAGYVGNYEGTTRAEEYAAYVSGLLPIAGWGELMLVPDLSTLYQRFTEKHSGYLMVTFCGLKFKAFLRVGQNNEFLYRIFSDINLGESDTVDVYLWPYLLRRENPHY